jgi:hypothetical protein
MRTTFANKSGASKPFRCATSSAEHWVVDRPRQDNCLGDYEGLRDRSARCVFVGSANCLARGPLPGADHESIQPASNGTDFRQPARGATTRPVLRIISGEQIDPGQRV